MTNTMTAYFPYSHLVSGIMNQTNDASAHHSYLVDWMPSDTSSAYKPAAIKEPVIAELYY